MLKKRNRLVILIVAVAASVSAAAVLAQSNADIFPWFKDGPSDMTPNEARDFTEFPLYSVGPQFEGIPLVGITRRKDEVLLGESVAANFVNFIYGDCQAEADAGCVPPLQIQTWAACERNPSVYPDYLPRTRTQLRGVPALVFEDGQRLELSTGPVTVIIFGRAEQARRAADALEAANTVAIAAGLPGGNLPPPAEGALTGTLSCASS
jgi:hypothetical protein